MYDAELNQAAGFMPLVFNRRGIICQLALSAINPTASALPLTLAVCQLRASAPRRCTIAT